MTSTFDLKMHFEGDEAILREIRQKLTDEHAGDSDLCRALSAIVQQTLIATGVPSDFNVRIQRSSIRRDFGQAGGLNANEWMESQ